MFMLVLHSCINCSHRLATDRRVKQNSTKPFFENQLAPWKLQLRVLYILLLCINCVLSAFISVKIIINLYIIWFFLKSRLLTIDQHITAYRDQVGGRERQCLVGPLCECILSTRFEALTFRFYFVLKVFLSVTFISFIFKHLS